MATILSPVPGLSGSGVLVTTSSTRDVAEELLLPAEKESRMRGKPKPVFAGAKSIQRIAPRFVRRRCHRTREGLATLGPFFGGPALPPLEREVLYRELESAVDQLPSLQRQIMIYFFQGEPPWMIGRLTKLPTWAVKWLMADAIDFFRLAMGAGGQTAGPDPFNVT